jgi:hypothetical protein
MLPFGVTIPATAPQMSEIPEGLMNYPVYVVIDGLYIPTSSHQHSVYPYLVTDIALPELCNHQTAATVRVTSSKIRDIEYTSMPSPVYQVMITPTVNLPSGRGTSIPVYVSLLGKCALGSYMFRCRRFN